MAPKRKNDAGPAQQVPKKRRRLSAGSISYHGRGGANDNYQRRQTRAQAALGDGSPLLFLDDRSAPRVAPPQAPRPAPAPVVYAADSSHDEDGDEDDDPPLSPGNPRNRRESAPSPEDRRPRPNDPQPCSRCKPTCGGIYGCLYYSDDSPSSSSSGSGSNSSSGSATTAEDEFSSDGSTLVGSRFSSEASTLMEIESDDQLEMGSSGSSSDEELPISSSQSPENNGPQHGSIGSGFGTPGFVLLGSWAEQESDENPPNDSTGSISQQSRDNAGSLRNESYYSPPNSPVTPPPVPDAVPFGVRTPGRVPPSPDFSPNSLYINSRDNSPNNSRNNTSQPSSPQSPDYGPPTSSSSSRATSSTDSLYSGFSPVDLHPNHGNGGHGDPTYESHSSGSEQVDYPDSDHTAAGAGEGDLAMDYRGLEEAHMDALLDQAMMKAEEEASYDADQEGDGGSGEGEDDDDGGGDDDHDDSTDEGSI